MDTQTRPIYDHAYGEEDEMSQSDLHNWLVDYMASVIKLLFANQVVGIFKSINLFGDPLHPITPKSPDLMVIGGLLQNPHHEYISYYIGPDNAPPRFLLEAASESTWVNDLADKPQVYQRMGVPEYFAADPHIDPVWTGMWGEQGRLIGWRLNPQTQLYQRITPDAHGRLWGDQLQSGLIMEGIGNRQLHLYDVAGNLRLTELEHTTQQTEAEQQQRLAAQALAQTERQQRLAAQALAQTERQQRLAEQQRVEKLKEMLRRFNPDFKEEDLQ